MIAVGPDSGGYEPGTIADLFLQGLQRPRERAYLRRGPNESWEQVSTDEVGRRVRSIALALRAAGFERGDRIGILSHTRFEWTLADFGLVMSGLVSVPVYPSLPPDQVAYVLANAGARAAFVSDGEQLAKIVEVRAELPELRAVFTFEHAAAPPAAGLEVVSLEQLIERGEGVPDDLAQSYEAYARETKPDDLATLIYTSGTTGPPKGVMLTHGNIHSNSVLATRDFPIDDTDVALSLLPLAHIFERTVGQYNMWFVGVTVAYSESPETVVRDLGEVGPTIMAAVPRVYEKVLERAEAAARESGGAKKAIFDWARRVGERRVDHELDGRPVGPWLKAQNALADRLVFSKLRGRTGGRIRYFFSGGAPLPAEVAKFFFAARLPIIEGYGLTETSPTLTFNPVDAVRLGTVGTPIAGTEIRIADDGEVLARGPQVMKGYYGQPEATAEVIDSDGWFHTGDIGELDDAGYLKITDRKKELIVTAYGKNIAPQPIEDAIKRDPLVAEAVMIGDRRKFPIVVVVPDFDALRAAAAELGVQADGSEALLAHEGLRTRLEEAVLSRCEPFANYEKPKRILPLVASFTVDGGELTPTLKVKRRVIAERYAGQIEEVYARAARQGVAEGRAEDFGG